MSAQLVLIGHSGAGKSSCLKHLGFRLEDADMDKALGTDPRPDLPKIRAWFAIAPAVVAASIHGLYELWFADIKSTGVTLVYLRKPKEQLPKHLSQAQPCGKTRPKADQRYTIESYPTLASIFEKVADYTIDCSNKDTSAVATEVKGLLERSATHIHA